MAAGGQTRRQAARPGPQVGRDDFIGRRRRGNGLEEEEMRSFAWIVGEGAGVEHVERAFGPTGPWREGFDGPLQVATWHYSLIYLRGVPPRHRQRPVGLAVVADGLLEQPRLVGGRRRHEVARGLHAVMEGKMGSTASK